MLKQFPIINYFYIYFFLISSLFASEIKIQSGNTDVKDLFGKSVDIKGNFIIVGAPYDNNNEFLNTGAAYIFFNNGLNWINQQKLVPNDFSQGDSAAVSVSISDSFAIIGVPWKKNSSSPAVYIFKLYNSTWIQQAKLVPDLGDENSLFGLTTAINDSFAVIGCNNNSVYIFKRDNENWVKHTVFSSDNGGYTGNFGNSISLYGEYLFIGAKTYYSSRGVVYIFKLENETWTEQVRLWGDHSQIDDNFGYSIDLSNNFAVIGEPGKDDYGENVGLAYVYERNGESWIKSAELHPGDPSQNINFGRAVALSEDTILVSSRTKNSQYAVYSFYYNGLEWIESSKVYASDFQEMNNFGQSIAKDDKFSIIGSPFQESYDDDQPGSAYIYNDITNIITPYISSVYPRFAAQGDTVQIEIKGKDTKFLNYLSVSLQRGSNEISASNIIANDDSRITAEFNIPINSDIALWDIRIIQESSAIDTILYFEAVNILEPGQYNQQITSVNEIEYNSISHTLDVYGLYTHFLDYTDVVLSLHNFKRHVNWVIAYSDTHLIANFSKVSNEMPSGWWDLSVVQKGYNSISDTVFFEDAHYLYNYGRPFLITEVVPDSAYNGDSLWVQITAKDSRFNKPDISAELYYGGSNWYQYTTDSIVVHSDELLDAYFKIPSDAPFENYRVGVYFIGCDGNGQCTTWVENAFKVLDSSLRPKITEIIPNEGYTNKQIDVNIYGSNTSFLFSKEVKLTNDSISILADNFIAVNDSVLTAHFNIKEDVIPSIFDIIVIEENQPDRVLVLKDGFRILQGNTSPTILLPTLADTTYPGSEYKYYPVIADAEQDTILLKILDAPVWLTVENDSLLSGTPGNSNTGTSKVKIRADDLYGGITDTSYSLTVINNSPPVPISDLRLSGEPGENKVFLKWTAPGGHWKEGQASSYDLRFSESPITESNFNSASVVSGLPVPNTFGKPDSMDVGGLTSSTKYYFALKSSNSEGQASSISNVLPAITAGTASNFPAEIISHGNSHAVVDSTYYYNETNEASAIGTAPISWSKVKGPDEFVISTDGKINWIPDTSDAALGSLLIIIRAENNYGNSDDSITVVFSQNNVTETVTSDTSDQFLDFSEAGVTMPSFDNQSDLSGTVTVNQVDTIPEDPGTGSAFSFGNQFWVIDSAIPDGEFQTTLVFYYDETKLDTLKEIELIIIHRKNQEDEWAVYPEQELDTLNNKITLFNVTGFSLFAPADDPTTVTTIMEKHIKVYNFTLNQNYPNPFNPRTTIEFTLPTSGKIIGTIYNILGQRIKTLVNEELKQGTHKYYWNGDNFNGQKVASGIYFLQLKYENHVIYKRMVLLR